MITTGTELLYIAASMPEIDRLYPRPDGPCGMCGGLRFRRGRPLRDLKIQGEKVEGWLKPTFTGYPEMKAHSQEAWICEACLFSLHERATIPGRDTLQKMRNYSHFVEGSQWWPCTKAEEGREFMARFLLNPHKEQWLACVATSGQKHLIFRTPVNAPGADLDRPIRIQVEEQFFSVVPNRLKAVLEDYEKLYNTFSKKEIDAGQYSPRRIIEFGDVLLMEIESRLAKLRGSGLFTLAGFLAIRRENKFDETETDGTADGDDSDHGEIEGKRDRGNKAKVSRKTSKRSARCEAATPGSGRESVQSLGSDSGSDGIASTANIEPAELARPSAEKAANPKPKQLALFDF